MVGEAPAHNEATGRDLCASLIGLATSGPAAERARRSGNASRWCWKGGWSRWGPRSTRPRRGADIAWNPRLVSTRRSIQAVAPLAPCVSQQIEDEQWFGEQIQLDAWPIGMGAGGGPWEPRGRSNGQSSLLVRHRSGAERRWVEAHQAAALAALTRSTPSSRRPPRKTPRIPELHTGES